MPLISSPAGNNHYRDYVASVFANGSPGGSLECENVLRVGHAEVGRRILLDGEWNGTRIISAKVNQDFGLRPDRYYGFGSGVPGLPGVQSINRTCKSSNHHHHNT